MPLSTRPQSLKPQPLRPQASFHHWGPSRHLYREEFLQLQGATVHSPVLRLRKFHLRATLQRTSICFMVRRSDVLRDWLRYCCYEIFLIGVGVGFCFERWRSIRLCKTKLAVTLHWIAQGAFRYQIVNRECYVHTLQDHHFLHLREYGPMRDRSSTCIEDQG
jgi:hypothetical protein